MSILYKKCQLGGKDEAGKPYIYNSVEDAAADVKFRGIPLKSPTTGTTLCYGSVTRGLEKCGMGYRSGMSKNYKTAGRIPGDDDNVIDAWDALNAAKNNPDDYEILYDRSSSSPKELEKLLENLPYGALLLTGDARDKGSGDVRTGRTSSGRRSFVSGKDMNPNRISRHAIGNIGFTKDGYPIIYDLGKFSKGVPEKYKGEINSIIVKRADKKYFRNPVAPLQEVEPKSIVKVEAPEVPINQNRIHQPIKLIPTEVNYDYYNKFIALLKNTFNTG